MNGFFFKKKERQKKKKKIIFSAKTIVLKQYYKFIIVEDFLLKEKCQNIIELPKIRKIAVNNSSRYIIKDKKYLLPSLLALEFLTSQKAKQVKAKKSIASFKIREKQILGAVITLRNNNLFYFLEKIIKAIIPQFREYNGFIFSSFDSKGNLTIGIQNPLIFPELQNFFEFFEILSGLDVTLSTNLKNKNQAFLLLSGYQIPLCN
jgi:large subunit ribosomal protein L5